MNESSSGQRKNSIFMELAQWKVEIFPSLFHKVIKYWNDWSSPISSIKEKTFSLLMEWSWYFYNYVMKRSDFALALVKLAQS